MSPSPTRLAVSPGRPSGRSMSGLPGSDEARGLCSTAATPRQQLREAPPPAAVCAASSARGGPPLARQESLGVPVVLSAVRDRDRGCRHRRHTSFLHLCKRYSLNLRRLVSVLITPARP